MSGIEVDFEKISQPERYKILIGSILPRPIAFVSTLGSDGVVNLAPYSFFNGIASDPACVMISATPKSTGELKDTLRNIEANRQFVVNVVSEDMAEPMNRCSAEFPYGVSELEKVGLTAVPSTKVRPPRVAESPIQLECELLQTLQIGTRGAPGSATVIFGKVLLAHFREGVWVGNRVQLEAVKPLARLAGASYGRIGETFTLERPSST